VKRDSPLLEPWFLVAAFLGVGLGTILLEQRARMALLWATLAVLGIIARGHRGGPVSLDPSAVGRGALLGLVIALPLLAFLANPLRAFTERLYASSDIVFLLYQVCFVAAPAEEVFFRGVIQDGTSLLTSLLLYAAAMLVLTLPHAPILVALLYAGAMGGLGIVYAYTYERYGLAASTACHVLVGLLLQVAPSAIEWARIVLS
jgi:membrane protease YdiL (CAAX protease family)